LRGRQEGVPRHGTCGGEIGQAASGDPVLGTPRSRYNRPPPAQRRPRAPISEPVMTKPLQTTIAGSLPKPNWLAKPGELWAPWRLEGEMLAQGKRDAVRLAVCGQGGARGGNVGRGGG